MPNNLLVLLFTLSHLILIKTLKVGIVFDFTEVERKAQRN